MIKTKKVKKITKSENGYTFEEKIIKNDLEEIKMTKCVQCRKEINCVGVILHPEAPTVTNLYVCFNSECPNFCLTQVGLSEVEKMENNGHILFQKKKGGMNFGGGIEGI